MKKTFTQPTPPDWIEALLSRAWNPEANHLVDLWLAIVEKHLEGQSS